MYDRILKNGRIMDGTGKPSYEGDIAIRDGRIEEVAPSIHEAAHEVVNLHGLAVAPGFIVTDMTLANKPAFESYRAASPIGMLGEPEYIAEAVSYVVSAEFLTGQVISPNGGLVI